MAKATRTGASIGPPESVVDTTAQEPPQSVKDLDEADEILEQANAHSEPEDEDQGEAPDATDESSRRAQDATAAPEPPKRNASQPAWAEFAASQSLEGAGDMSRDELVAWWDKQQEETEGG